MGTPKRAVGRKVEVDEVIGYGSDGKSCPTIYTTKTGRVVVQGYTVAESNVDVPSGESMVELPGELITMAAKKLAG